MNITSRKLIGAAACIGACLLAPVTWAGDLIYTLSGTVDFSALEPREKAALKISAPYSANVTIKVYIDDATTDRNPDPEEGDYRPRRTDISLGGQRYSVPERSVRGLTQAPLRNTNFSLWDKNVDSLNWQYNPSSRSTLNSLNLILLSLFVPDTALRSDELRNLSDAQSLLDSRTVDPQFFIRTVKGNTYLMDMTDPELTFEETR